MNRQVVSAVFDSRAEAERAVTEIRRAGVRDSAISVVTRRDDSDLKDGGHDHSDHDTKASGTAKGLGIGAGAGGLAGLAALFIPGVGPFIAAGAVAETLGVIGSAAATSAVVGGAIGGLTGALMDYGLSEDDARYYDKRISEGGVWVAVDTSASSADPALISRMLRDAGGKTNSSHATETAYSG